MGRKIRMRHLDDELQDKQPGCMGGLVQVLDYNNWQSNVRKMIQQRKYDDQTQHKCHWSPESKMSNPDDNEGEKLLVENESPYLSTKRSGVTKKKSLKARIKALVAKEISIECEGKQDKKDLSFKPSLHRTYSIHHLESLDYGISTKRADFKYPIAFVPQSMESSATQSFDTTQMKVDSNQEDDPTDVLEIFKVDKGLLKKHLQAKFIKSRSFPVSERRKLKPTKLENKSKEIWSFPPRENKFQTVNGTPGLERSGYFGKRSGEQGTNNMDKYAQLFETSFRMGAKLNISKSLKLTNDYGHAPVYFRRIRSLSNVDSFYSNHNYEVTNGDCPSGNGSVVIVENSSLSVRHSEEEKVASLLTSDKENVRPDTNMQIQEKGDDDCEREGNLKEEAEKSKKSDSLWEKDSCSLDISSFQETEFHAVDHRISQGFEHGSSIQESNFPNDPRSLHNNSDLHYVRRLLDLSGMALNASEMMWHATDQPFGPQLFEKAEAYWDHERDQLDVWPDFIGCWHHQMLFDLVNEVLVELYDLSLPYYPKALSSSCHVRPFPVGDHIIEDVCSSVSLFLDLETQEKEWLGAIVARDRSHDDGWMNLQVETESVALELEDVIFNELLEEVVLS